MARLSAEAEELVRSLMGKRFDALTDDECIELEDRVGDIDLGLAYERMKLDASNVSEDSRRWQEYQRKTALCTELFDWLAEA